MDMHALHSVPTRRIDPAANCVRPRYFVFINDTASLFPVSYLAKVISGKYGNNVYRFTTVAL